MNNELYASLEIRHFVGEEGAEADALNALRDAGFQTLGERMGHAASTEIRGTFTAYGIDGEGAKEVAKHLASLARETAFLMRTEEERGEPGLLLVHVTGHPQVELACDRGGDVVLAETEVRRIAATDDPQARQHLMDELTGKATRNAFEALAS